MLSEENKKSEPFSYREKVRIFIVWCDGRDSNPRPTDSQRAFVRFSMFLVVAIYIDSSLFLFLYVHIRFSLFL